MPSKIPHYCKSNLQLDSTVIIMYASVIFWRDLGYYGAKKVPILRREHTKTGHNLGCPTKWQYCYLIDYIIIIYYGLPPVSPLLKT